MAVDHEVVGVRDLELAARSLLSQHGLVALDGGRHPDWGPANRIVPLGSTYFELVTVVDPARARTSAFGRWVARMIDGRSCLGWAVRTPDLATVCARLGLEISLGTRRSGDGTVLRWQLAGVDEAAADPSLPFFIERGESTPVPGRSAAPHPGGEVALSRLSVGATVARLTHWLGVPVADVAGLDGQHPFRLVDHGVVAALDQGSTATAP